MGFEVVGAGADGQEQILETFLVQKGDFDKAQGLWAERAALRL